MIRMSAARIDWHVGNWKTYLLVGLALWSQLLLLPRGGVRIGLLIGFMLLSLGIYGFALRRWRTEPGLWMLAILIAIGWTPGYLLLEYKQLLRFIAGARAMAQLGVADLFQILRMLEITLGLALMWTSVRLATSIALENWRRTKRQNTSSP